MIKYTIQNNYRFIELIDIVTNDIVSMNKETVREIYKNSDDPYLFIIHLDDIGDHKFRYDEIENPETPGLTFTSIDIFRDYMLESVNDIAATDTVPLGTWNPNTNLPTLASGGLYDSTGDNIADKQSTANQYYLVGEDGTYLLDGTLDWLAGDYVKSNGSLWIKISSSDNIYASKVVYNETTVDISLDDIYSKLFLEYLGDVDITTVSDGDALVFNVTTGKWEPEAPSGTAGRIILHILGFVSPEEAAPTIDGLYILTSGAIPLWAPLGTVANDIIELSSGVWSIHTLSIELLAGELEIDFENPTDYTVNYVWNGNAWISYNAYTPHESLENITQTTPLGDLNGYTGGQLRGKAISWVLDTILFSIVYNPPVTPTVSLGSFDSPQERGDDISGLISINYSQNGGGITSGYSIIAIESNVIKDTETGIILPNDINLDNINGYNLLIPSTVGEEATAALVVSYDDGLIPEDNQGNQYPGDQIMASNIQTERTYTAAYPIWYGATSEGFTIEAGDESTTNPFVAPNNGSNLSGLELNEAWVRANLNKQLFTSNLNSETDSIQVGTVHVLIVCPPGIVVTTGQIYAAGNWIDWNALETNSFILPVNNAAGSDPKNYTVYYARSTAADSFSAIQNFRFTTSGSIIP